MKKFLLGAMLTVAALGANAQRITNNSYCEIIVSQTCYDPVTCTQSTNWTVFVPPLTQIPLPAYCLSPKQTSYKVCWNNPVCTPMPCTVVDGTIPLGTCSGEPYSNPIGICDMCSTPGNNGVGTVTYNPATRSLIVNP